MPRARASRALVGVLLLAGVASPRTSPAGPRPGVVPPALRHVTPVAQVSADFPLPYLTVLLGVRHREALEALLAAQQDRRSPRFRQWLDDTELADRFGPSRTEYEGVRRWFVGRGFRVVHDSPHRLALVVAGTAGAVQASLGTTVARFPYRGRLHRGPTSEPVLPADIATSVRGVLGLDDLPAFHPLVRLDGGPTALAPGDFAAAYQVTPLYTAGLTGAGQAIAVVARSNFADSDIDLFARRFLAGPRPVPRRRLVGADPGIADDPAEEREVLLDTQWAGALAPGAQVNVVIGSPDGGIPEALAQAVSGREGDVISISFGLCEPAATALFIELFDALYAFANAKGQTVVVAAGDAGATECAPAETRRPAVNLLASSPHALAVGGTSFALGPDGTPALPLEERVWDDDFGAGGGGDSELFARPPYQLAAGLPPTSRGRALPDVAVAASPRAPGYVVVQGGQSRIAGGTSAGAPALASVLALLSERLRRTIGIGGLGQLVPQLYRLGSEQARGLRPPVFRDVTSGSNDLPGSPGFPAGPGYDRASGWGAPLGDALAAALEGPGRCEPEIDCLVPGRGPRRRACRGEWLVEHGVLRSRGGIPIVRQSCRDGDPACDADGQPNGTCVINVALCVNMLDARPAFLDHDGRPVCRPGRVRRVRMLRPVGGYGDALAAGTRRALKQALAALPFPGTLRDACTASVPVLVSASGRGRAVLRASVQRSRGATVARLVLRCAAS